MPDRHKEVRRLEIDWVYRANGPIPLDESVPLRISLPLEGNGPQKDGEIVGKKSWTAVIKVEEDRLSFQRPISCNPRVATESDLRATSSRSSNAKTEAKGW